MVRSVKCWVTWATMMSVLILTCHLQDVNGEYCGSYRKCCDGIHEDDSWSCTSCCNNYKDFERTLGLTMGTIIAVAIGVPVAITLIIVVACFYLPGCPGHRRRTSGRVFISPAAMTPQQIQVAAPAQQIPNQGMTDRKGIGFENMQQPGYYNGDGKFLGPPSQMYPMQQYQQQQQQQPLSHQQQQQPIYHQYPQQHPSAPPPSAPFNYSNY